LASKEWTRCFGIKPFPGGPKKRDRKSGRPAERGGNRGGGGIVGFCSRSRKKLGEKKSRGEISLSKELGGSVKSVQGVGKEESREKRGPIERWGEKKNLGIMKDLEGEKVKRKIIGRYFQ